MKNYKNSKIGFKKTSSARRFVMQALYSWIISNSDLILIEQHYLEERNPKNFDVDYFKLLLHKIVANKHDLEQKIIQYSSRTIKQLDPIEFSILLVASYELLFCKHIPFKVIISEALELANMFGSQTSYKFINSVLDRLAQECR